METDKIFDEKTILMVIENLNQFSSIYVNNADILIRLTKMTFESFETSANFFFKGFKDIFSNMVGQSLSVIDPENAIRKDPESLVNSISSTADLIAAEFTPAVISSTLLPLGALVALGMYRLSGKDPKELKDVVVGILTDATKVANSINSRTNASAAKYAAALAASQIDSKTIL